MTLEIRMAPPHQSEPLRLASESLRLACRPFRPKYNDITAKFVRGTVPGEMVEVPTYAAVDPRALQVELGKLARQYGYIFLDELAESGSSEIVKRTFQEAFRYAVSHSRYKTSVVPGHCMNLNADSIHKGAESAEPFQQSSRLMDWQ